MNRIDPNKALDELISLLDKDPASDTECVSEDSEDDVPLVNNDRAIIELCHHPASPVRKRPRLKTNHCKYCEEVCNKENLEAHLNDCEDCKTSYFRDLKVTKVDAVLCLLFKCLFCESGPAKLSLHLATSQDCYDNYCTKFGVGSVR